ncbi:MAG: formylglycine-generating enzyme family protein [Planctomycetes bacterium]|nr:formylglycine-generating enzyme family protein [Planctomycetota bacterium]
MNWAMWLVLLASLLHAEGIRQGSVCPLDGREAKRELHLDAVGMRLYACSGECLTRLKDKAKDPEVLMEFVRGDLVRKQYEPEQLPVKRSREWSEAEMLKGMALIEGGEYVRTGTYHLYQEEKPVRGERYAVRLKPFYMDKHEVTVEDYCRFLNDGNEDYWTPWYPKIKRGDDGRFAPASADDAKYPAAGATYFQARGYAEWAGKRLPTEAEWEYAAGRKDGRTYPWGNEEPDKSRTNYGGSIAPVGSLPKGATPQGVSDLLGNVTEWCADYYSEDYYRKAPPGGLMADPQGPERGYNRMTRGGCTGMKMTVFTRHARTPLLSAG